MHIKKGDNVVILSGKDKGKSGKVLRSIPKEMKVIVEGVNIRKIHQKSRKADGKGSIVEKAFPIHASTAKLVK
jgi:large subunit ribosomal protein L24